MTPIPVLVVDDNAAFLNAARESLALATPQFAIYTVQSGNEAFGFLERRPPFTDAPRPAFVLLDFRLPDMNAPAVLERLRAHPDLRTLPVFVLSGAAWAEDEDAARRAGATLFRQKPSRVRALREVVTMFWKEYVDAGAHPAGRG